MAKYVGKYKKCRSCVNVIKVHMTLVEVKDSCPYRIRFNNMICVDKSMCETCESYQESKNEV